MSLAFACALALPVKLRVAWVASTRVTTAVRPAGTFPNDTPGKAAPLVPVNVSLANVMVAVVVIEPSFAADSANEVAL